MPTADLNGVQIHYEITGSGSPLLVIAGLGQSSWAWTPVLPRLTERFRCITVDNRGTGRSSDTAGDHRIEDLAADTAALVDHLGLGPVPAVGWSRGGSVLQAMLVDHPSVLERAVLLSAFPSYTELQHAWLGSVLALRGSGADRISADLAMVVWSFTPRLLTDHDRALRAARAAGQDPHPTSDAVFRKQAAAVSAYDSRGRLPGVRVPTLVLTGAEDVLTPVAQAVEMTDLIPNSTLRILPRGSHAMILEYPDDTIAAITDFLCR